MLQLHLFVCPSCPLRRKATWNAAVMSMGGCDVVAMAKAPRLGSLDSSNPATKASLGVLRCHASLQFVTFEHSESSRSLLSMPLDTTSFARCSLQVCSAIESWSRDFQSPKTINLFEICCGFAACILPYFEIEKHTFISVQFVCVEQSVLTHSDLQTRSWSSADEGSVDW